MLRLVLLNRLWAVVPSPTASNLPSAATLTLLTPSTLMVSFQTRSPHLRWSAGQHFYVVMPGMSRLPWEAHPFTATTIPARPGYGTESGELTFIVRVRDGFTKEMKLNVDKERKTRGLDVDGECKVEVKAAVEGPYGGTTDMSRYNGIVIISGELELIAEKHASDHNQADPGSHLRSLTCYRSSAMPGNANPAYRPSESYGWSSHDVGHTCFSDRFSG